jgi:hypothetical protein
MEMMMKKRIVIIGLCILWLGVVCGTAHAQSLELKRFHVSLSGGFGLPKIPFSHFRTPISVLGGTALNMRLFDNWLVQVDGYALYTFNMGTASGEGGELKFNVAWATFDLLRHLRGVYRHSNFILAGVGRYHLMQQFESQKDDLNTTGICLGLVDWRHWKRFSMVTEIRWHLLFDPSPQPQILSITLGILL